MNETPEPVKRVTTCTVVRAAPVGVRCSFSNDVLDNPSLILHGLSYTLSSLVTIFMSNPNNRGSAHLVHVDQQSVEHRNLRADAEILLPLRNMHIRAVTEHA